MRIPSGGLATAGLCLGARFLEPATPDWTDIDGDFNPDCDLNNPLEQNNAATGGDICGPIDNLLRHAPAGRRASSIRTCSGWGKRPSDWAFGLSIQQELFPRASVEVGYHRRSFTMFLTGGTVTDNLSIGPNDVASYTVTVPSDSLGRLPNGGDTIGPLYNMNPNVFGQVNQLINPTDKSVTTRACSTAST